MHIQTKKRELITMREESISKTNEEKMNTILKEIMDHFQLDYISDIHIEYYHNKIMDYIEETALEATDYELYIKLIEYVNWK